MSSTAATLEAVCKSCNSWRCNAPLRVCLGLCLMAAFFGFLKPAAVYSIILKGTVVMPDGSPLAFTAGIERICSDNAGSAPGPTTNKKGEYLWRVVRPSGDPSQLPRRYVSWLHFHIVEISSLDTTRTTTTLPPLVLSQSARPPSDLRSLRKAGTRSALWTNDCRDPPRRGVSIRREPSGRRAP